LSGNSGLEMESGEIERAFLVEPAISDEENAEKNKHREQREGNQMLSKPRAKQDGPGKKKDSFHFEDHEEHGNDVEAGGVTSAGAGFRKDAAFVRLKFGGAPARAGADVFEDNKRDDGKRESQQRQEEKRDVGGWHWMAYGRMLTQMMAGFFGSDPI